MKKITIILILLCCFFITSCYEAKPQEEDNDVENNVDSNELTLKDYFDFNAVKAASIFKYNVGANGTSVEELYFEKEELKQTTYYDYDCQSSVAFDVKTATRHWCYHVAWEFLDESAAEEFLDFINKASGYQRCFRMGKIVYENTVACYFLLENYKTVGDYLVSNDGKTFIGLKDGITSTSIEVILPDEIEIVAGHALLERSKDTLYTYDITRVVCNQNLKLIGAFSFQNLVFVEEIILNEGLEAISIGAFHSITRLENIDIVLPSTVISISDDAFAYVNLFVNVRKGGQQWNANVNLGEEVNIYYKNMWHYNKDGKPEPLE